MEIYIYGASGHAKVVIELAEACAYKVIAAVDVDPKKTTIFDYEILREIPDAAQNLCIAIGNNTIRKQLALRYSTVQFPTLVHPSANISKRAAIGSGTVVMAGVSINSHAQIGAHCIINTNASIDHDCIIGDYVHISPNVALAGNVSVGEGTHIGIGAAVIQQVSIGKNCTIGAGAVIIKDIPDGCTVVGNPGKIIKSNN